MRGIVENVSDIVNELNDLLFCKKNWEAAIAAISKHCQAGGEFAHLLLPGDSITTKGPQALVDEIHRLQGEIFILRGKGKPNG